MQKACRVGIGRKTREASQARQQIAARASIFRRSFHGVRRHAQLAELLDESCAPQIQETGRVCHGAVGTLESLLDQAALDGEQMCAQVETFLRKNSESSERIERRGFDRRWRGEDQLLRLPQEDFCQALSVPTQSTSDAGS